MNERQIQRELCKWIKYNYPEIIFQSDIASGMYLTQGQSSQAKLLRSHRGNPDLFIAEPKEIWRSNKYSHNCCGLFLELKVEGTKIFREKDAAKILKGEYKLRKAGDYWDQHIEEQGLLMDFLSRKGYRCSFAIGLKEAKKIITEYLNL